MNSNVNSGTTISMQKAGGKPFAIGIKVIKTSTQKHFVFRELNDVEREASFKLQNATTAHYMHVVQHVKGKRQKSGQLDPR